MTDRFLTRILTVLLALGALPAQRGQNAAPSGPPTVRWQRTLADAEAVAKARHQPLFICVNMNGEAASERLASGRYRSPEFAKLAAGFVAVIASPDRHNPLDHDAEGRRIPCPRFGCVTCGEHIAIEPLLFEKYFANNRVAPRHMGIGVDGKTVLFDIFLTNDFETIDAALREHGKPVEGGAVPAEESSERERAEAAYLAAAIADRSKLLAAAAKAKHRPYDLLRLGMKDADAGVRASARKAFAAVAEASALPMLVEILDAEAERDARKDLVPALARIADDKPETKLALLVHQAMVQPAKVVDRDAWLAALQQPPPVPAPPDEDLEERLDRLTASATANPKDAAVLIDLADAHLRFVKERFAAGRDIRFVLVDAQQAANKAVAAAPDDWRARALAAVTAQMQGERAAAAEHARKALPGLQAAGLAGSIDAATVLVALAEGAAEAIYSAEAKKARWSGELLAEADAAYDVLAAHPAGSATQVAAHASVLSFLGLRGAARAALLSGLARFTADVALHDALRAQVTATSGVPALTAVYAELGQRTRDEASLRWFAGRAELVVAEFHKRAGVDAPALAAYGRALAGFEASRKANPEYAASATWYEAFAQAGRARVCLDTGDLAAAAAAIGDAIARKPDIAEQEDGLGRTPLFTLKQVWGKLGEDEATKERLAAQVREASATLWAKVAGG